MSLLRDLHRSGQLRTLDHALATSLKRLREDTPDSVALAAALASLAVAQELPTLAPADLDPDPADDAHGDGDEPRPHADGHHHPAPLAQQQRGHQ